MSKKYSLVIFENNKIIREIVTYSSIKKMDDFTENYIGYYNLLYEFGYSSSYRVVLINNDNDMEMPIVYAPDAGYIREHDLKEEYLDYLKNNRGYIEDCLVRYVKVGARFNRYMSDSLLERACNIYFNKSYKASRDAYFELIRFGNINRITNGYRENIMERGFIPESGIDYLDNLMMHDDFDNIFKTYDIDDMPIDVYRYVTTKRRVLKRDNELY